jgi:hypothetical protein
MAAAILAVRRNEEEIGDGNDVEGSKFLDNLRISVPEKESRDAELLLGVLVLG